MINVKDLDMDFRPKTVYSDGSSVTSDTVQQALANEAAKMGIPIAFYTEQIKIGGLMGIGGVTEDCIVLHHPDHRKDYFSFVVRVSHQGAKAVVSIDGFGRSKLMKAEESRQRMKDHAKGYLKEAVLGDGGSQDMVHGLANALGSGIRSGLSMLTGQKARIEEESNWYRMVSVLFDAV